VSAEWEAFYAPHTDDETIGMAGAIARARGAGRNVLVVLVTDNLPSARGRGLFPSHDLLAERRKEWRDAMRALDVTETQEWEIPEENMPSHLAHIRSTIREEMLAIQRTHGVVHHHTTWGMWDHNQGVRCLAHDLCASAAYELSFLAATRVSLYGIYEYAKPSKRRAAPVVQHLSKGEHLKKRDALMAYYPRPGSIGYGYASVPELMEAARADPREFVIDL
jgi:LmbE family N-acetylglucosaminyl deacetylase